MDDNICKIIQEYSYLAFSDITNYLEPGSNAIRKDLDSLPEEQRKCIKKISTRTTSKPKQPYGETTSSETWLELHSKPEALKQLATYYGLFSDFNAAIATLANKYGIEVWLDENGEPQARRKNVLTDSPTYLLEPSQVSESAAE